MLKVYILDDEQNAVDGLRAMLQKKFGERVRIVGSNIHPLKAIEELENLDVDILFLDVEMPSMNGTDVLRHFPNKTFHVIFTTAHEKYAIPAIKLKVVDYLLKPLSPMDVQDAIDRVEEQMKLQLAPVENKITLSVQGSMHIIPIADIIRIEADSNYSIFYIKDKARLMVSRTLKDFEAQLSAHSFFRIHQSHLINMQHVSGIQRNDGDFVIMDNGDKVELSRRKKAEFLALIK
ncbi:MAG TPA: LytTR family DNA-binding domain-containing protein [Saprospiraceae bacterium]|nr:LytTR family DNA-binding domain-containing protein [Saprospiraceae bacterium]